MAAGLDDHPPENRERVRRRVHQALQVDLEVIAILPIAPQHPPFEPRRLPVSAPEGRAALVRDDVPARDGKREVQLADPQYAGTGHEVLMSGAVLDPCPTDD